jgi:hypothetical protein
LRHFLSFLSAASCLPDWLTTIDQPGQKKRKNTPQLSPQGATREGNTLTAPICEIQKLNNFCRFSASTAAFRKSAWVAASRLIKDGRSVEIRYLARGLNIALSPTIKRFYTTLVAKPTRHPPINRNHKRKPHVRCQYQGIFRKIPVRSGPRRSTQSLPENKGPTRPRQG